MSDDDEEDEEEPAVELGEGSEVEGAPLARVASRLQWPIEKSRAEMLEGDATIRTPEGPKRLSRVLDRTDTTYFDRKQTFLDAVRDQIGRGPIPTADGGATLEEPEEETGSTAEAEETEAEAEEEAEAEAEEEAEAEAEGSESEDEDDEE